MVRLVFILLLVSGCTSIDRANRHLKKADKHLQKAIALGAEVKNDTVFTDRTYYVPEYKTDAVVKVENFTDTIRIENERVAWKVKVNTIEKKIYVEAKCKADTVTVEVPVVVHKEIKAGYSLWDIILLAIIVFAVGVLVSPFLKKLIR